MEPTKSFIALCFETPEHSIPLADQFAVNEHNIKTIEATDGNVAFKYVPFVLAFYSPRILAMLKLYMADPVGMSNNRAAYNLGKTFPLSKEVQADADKWQPFEDLLNLLP